jgi:chromosome segregation ATPase
MSSVCRELSEQLDRLAEENKQLKAQLTQTNGAVTISRNGYVQELEQQRNEARAEIEKLKEELEWQAWTISPAMAQAKIDKLVEQRDRAHAKIERQAERIKYLEGATNHATGTPLSKMREQLDRLAEALGELCETLLKDKPRDITELLNKAGNALAAVKGKDS